MEKPISSHGEKQRKITIRLKVINVKSKKKYDR